MHLIAKTRACAYLTTKIERHRPGKPQRGRTLKRHLIMSMKLLIISLTALCLQAGARGYSQGISLSLKDAPLPKALQEITRQSGTTFLYTEKLLRQSLPVNVTLVNASIEQAVNACLMNQPLEWKMINRTIVIRRKTKFSSPLEDSVRIFRGVVHGNGGVLAGASVMIKGTNKGTLTDQTGAFVIRVSKNQALIITSIGYEGQLIQTGNLSFIEVTLIPAVNKLDEAVVIGYGTTTKRYNTGSVSKISSNDITTQPVSNSLAAMTGRLPGVFITQQTGVPGGNFTIQIRGRNSIREEGNDPLYIIDGVPYASTTLSSLITSSSIIQRGNPLSGINPNDIESIEVLKDADATSIYGSRGANGVVLITTKKGKAGSTRLSVDFSTGWGKPASKMKLLDSKQYLRMRHEAFANDGIAPGSNDVDLNGEWDTTRNTDWQKELLGNTARVANTLVSVSSGNEYTQFIISGAHRRETAVFPGKQANEKAMAHFNLSHSSVGHRFKLLISALGSKENNYLPQADLYYSAITLPPVAPALYNADGTLNWQNSTWDNPLANLLRKFRSGSTNIVTNGVLSYELLNGLIAKASFGYNTSFLDELSTNPSNSLRPSYGVTTSSAFFAKGQRHSWIVEPQLSYQTYFGRSRLQALAGATLQENRQEMTTTFGRGYTSIGLLENIQAAPVIAVILNEQTQYRYGGAYGRINYTLDDKYVLNLTGRRDGSSRFGPGKQFGNFGSAAAAWIFSGYDWVKRSFPVLSFGKLRGSFGTSGNDQIGDYRYLNTYSPSQYGYEGITGLQPTALFNPDYSWEKNRKTDAALELGFFKDRLLVTVNYYFNTSSNQLVGYSLAPTTGFFSIVSNFPATVSNRGWEFELNTINVQSDAFSWKTSFNLSFPKNKLVSFRDIANTFYNNSFEVGKSLDTRKLLHATGVDPVTGIYQFLDVNKNGSNTDYPDDLLALANLGQVFHGGLQNNIRYKQWMLDFFFQFVKQKGLNYLTSYYNPPGALSNQPAYVLDHWQPQHTQASVQQYTTGANGEVYLMHFYALATSDLAVSDASYVRLKNVAVRYDVTANLLRKWKLRGLTIYAQAQNLLTFTNYKGSDPENNVAGRLPPLRMFTAGITVTL